MSDILDHSTHPDDFADLPALPFTPADFAAADTTHRLMRTQGVRLAIAGDHEAFPAVVEVTTPSDPDTRWMLYRNAAGVWVDELNLDLNGPWATMAEALAFVTDVLETERQATIDAISTSLIPNLPPLVA